MKKRIRWIPILVMVALLVSCSGNPKDGDADGSFPDGMGANGGFFDPNSGMAGEGADGMVGILPDTDEITVSDPIGISGQDTLKLTAGNLSVKYSSYDLDASDREDTTVVLKDRTAQIDGDGASFADGILTITDEGCYRLSGTMTGGRIVISADSSVKVRLILDGLTVECLDNAAIYAESADKVVLTLAEGSENRIVDGDTSEKTEESQRAPAAIYAKCSLSINGSGKLTVDASYHNAIATKKVLRVAGGVLQLTAKNVGIKGNNAVLIGGGQITVQSTGDGVKTEEEEDTSKGYIFISGGDLTVTTESDGVNGSLYTYIVGGNVQITTTGTEISEDASSSNEWQPTPRWGGGNRPGGDRPGGDIPGGNMPGGVGGNPGGNFPGGFGESSISAPDSKGVKAGSELLISGGNVTVNSTGHAIHSSGTVTVSDNAKLVLNSSSGKGIQGHGDVLIKGGKINITNSTEGIESKTNLYVSGGTVRIYATDDGMNMASSSGELVISGGNLLIAVANGDTDGIDSNNTMTISGGQVVIRAQSASGNMAALDADRTIRVTGGTLVTLCGTSGPQISSTITGGSLSASLPQGEYTLVDADGQTVFSFTVPSSVNGCWIGSELLRSGSSYVLKNSEGEKIADWKI